MEASQRLAILYALLGKHGAHILVEGIARSGYRPDCLDEQLSRYVWTTERPTQPGWYWFKGRVASGNDRRQLRFQPYEVKPNDFWGKGGLALHETDHLFFSIDELNGEWTGPLEMPE